MTLQKKRLEKHFSCVDCKKSFVYRQSIMSHKILKHGYTSEQYHINKCERHGFLEPCPMCENET